MYFVFNHFKSDFPAQMKQKMSQAANISFS